MSRQPVGRQQLLTVGADLLAQTGQLDLGTLVGAAGLTTGAVYHHFGSKSGLLVAIYEEFYDGLDAAVADRRLPQDATWADREQQRTRHMVAYFFDHPLAQLMLDRAGEPEVSTVEAAYIEKMSVATAAHLIDAQREGHVHSSLDVDTAGSFIIGGLRQGIAHQIRRTPRPTVDDAAAVLWQLSSATATAITTPQRGEEKNQ